MESTIKEVTGKLFKDGPYEYMIYIKSGDLGVGVINSISVVIENIPDYVGIDVLLYAMSHVIDAGGEELKNSQDEFMMNRIVMKKYSALGEIMTAMGLSTEFGLQSFTQLNNTILEHKDKKIDLKEIKQKVYTRINKLTKAMEYIANTFTSPIEGMEIKLSYNVAGSMSRLNNSIVPALRLDVNIITDKAVSISQKDEIGKAFKDQLQEISPIQIQTYDIIAITVDFRSNRFDDYIGIKK